MVLFLIQKCRCSGFVFFFLSHYFHCDDSESDDIEKETNFAASATIDDNHGR